MAINNYLIIGVNPANNETTVSLDKVVTITFSKHMDIASLNASNIFLKIVNGDVVPCDIEYDSLSMTAKLVSGVVGLGASQYLEPNTQYQLTVSGGSTGVRSITGDYMGVSRTYEFTTSFEAALSQPMNLTATVDSGFTTLTWTRPTDYDIAKPLTYEIQVSTSNDPLNAPVWPSVGDINKTNSTVLNIPKKFTDGNYYAYVRALNDTETSGWSFVQFAVQTATSTPIPNEPNGDIFSFYITETYPKRDSADISPEKIMIVFSSNVDTSTIDGNSIYIVKKEDKANLSFLDFMMDYAPDKKIAATIEPTVIPNVVTLTAALEDDAEYTVIIRETVKSLDSASLGTAYHWSFVTTYSRLYGDPNLIRQDMGSFSNSITDKVLYKYLSEATESAYQIVSATSAFDANDYLDGKAPYYVHQYVRYLTSYDLLLNTQLRAGGGAFTTDIQLGDLKVTKEAGAGGSASSILSELASKIKPLLDLMHGHHNRGYAKPIVVVKGENVATYPDFLTRTEFNELGQ